MGFDGRTLCYFPLHACQRALEEHAKEFLRIVEPPSESTRAGADTGNSNFASAEASQSEPGSGGGVPCCGERPKEAEGRRETHSSASSEAASAGYIRSPWPCSCPRALHAEHSYPAKIPSDRPGGASPLARPRIPLSFVASFSSQAASALAYMHRLNLIHRDIAPNNLLLTEDLTVKVATWASPDSRPGG
ncbi:hypothetical protein Q5P01_000985 [Channa striata]|uniref:Protein kinase domain-containing protein n=1 Tax=Channa striata TaxID=64152 RepID=A0AA88LIL1_CHASR|nr:hypothetical protein Q5P01_000985 [Channa striata]